MISYSEMRTIQKKVIEDPLAFGTSLVAILIDLFGTECFDWEPEAIRLGLKDDIHADPPDENRDKYLGLILAITTDRFYVTWDAYMHVCRALNGHGADFETMHVPDPEDMAWGVAEVLLNDPPSSDSPIVEFSAEVATYTGVVLYDNGIWQPPKILNFAEYPDINPEVGMDDLAAEDPMTFKAAYRSQDIRRNEIDTFVTEKMTALKNELAQIPLANRQDKASA